MLNFLKDLFNCNSLPDSGTSYLYSSYENMTIKIEEKLYRGMEDDSYWPYLEVRIFEPKVFFSIDYGIIGKPFTLKHDLNKDQVPKVKTQLLSNLRREIDELEKQRKEKSVGSTTYQNYQFKIGKLEEAINILNDKLI